MNTQKSMLVTGLFAYSKWAAVNELEVFQTINHPVPV